MRHRSRTNFRAVVPFVKRSAAARRSRARQPGAAFEALEPRTMLSATAATPLAAHATGVLAQENQAYVAALVGTDLNNSAGQAALDHRLTAELDRGMSRERVVLELLRSRPSRTIQVDSAYQGLLGHAPTGAQLRTGLALVEKTGDTRALETKIIGSAAFLRGPGTGTSNGFLSALYQEVLDREPTNSETAAGLKTLAAHVSRAKLAGELINSRGARTLLIENEQSGLGASSVSATPSDYREMSQPGGLLRIMAGVLASGSVYDRLVSPPAATAPTSAPNPLPGYPQAPGFNLTSSVQPLGVSAAFLYSVHSVSVGNDDDPWFATPQGLSLYNLVTGALTQVPTPEEAISVSAIDANEAYAVIIQEQTGINEVIQALRGSVSTLPPLPGSDVPAQVSASDDGLVWALAESGNLDSYSAATQSWSTISTDAYSLKTISVGSASNIVALTTSGVPLQYTTAGGFQPIAALTGTYQAVQATSDGAEWAVQDGLVAMKPSYGTWQLAKVQPPSGQVFVWFAAGSMNRGFESTVTDSNGQFSAQVNVVSIGVVDRQPVPFPAFTGLAEQAYMDFSANVTDASGGIRALYATPGLDWGTIQKKLDSTTEPVDITSGVWQSVQNQLDDEILDVSNVYSTLDVLETLDTDIQVLNLGSLTTAGQVEGLVVHGQNSNSTITLVLEDLFEAIADSIADAGIPPAGAVAASLLASGFSDGISYFESQNNYTPDQAVPIAYSQLANAISTIYSQALVGLNADINAVVTDYGKLTAVGGAILNQQWPITNLSLSESTSAANNAFSKYFYQTLTAAGWQIVYLLNYTDYNVYPITQILSVDAYDIYQVPLRVMEDGVPAEDVYVMNQLGNTIDLNSPDLGANIPVSQLFTDIAALGTDTLFNFWTSEGDWAVITHVAGRLS